VPQSSTIMLASGAISPAGDNISIELRGPAEMPASIVIQWPPQPSIITPARFPTAAATIVRLFARASTELTRIRVQQEMCDGLSMP
jgi:hypothetical protein